MIPRGGGGDDRNGIVMMMIAADYSFALVFAPSSTFRPV
ncbi:hypothetical protein ACHAW5_003539 [Stephanodiscus triporus]|uniref:Uncharacterized protein n=1 Tax=Stephanodiscus triporus TaxID=2934178 RepID=A0ABD3NYJ3_9STRA